MKWFEHDTNSLADSKIKHLVMRHGAVGYAVYFHCLELIAGNLSENNITFELEHDCVIIADDLKINGDGKKAGCDIVQEIMMSCIDLRLFQSIGTRVFCFPMAKRVGKAQIKNPRLKEMQTAIIQGNVASSLIFTENHGKVMLPTNQPTLPTNQQKINTATEKFEDEQFEDPEPTPPTTPTLQYFHPCLHAELWNSLGLTKFTRTRLNISSNDLDQCRKGTEGRNFEEIQESMRNYHAVQTQPETYRAPFAYTGLINFLSKGVETYASLEPFKKSRGDKPREMTEAETLQWVRENLK